MVMIFDKKFKMVLRSLLLTLSYNPRFKQPKQRRLLKTLLEKEKMLVTGFFSFSHNVSHSMQNKGLFKLLCRFQMLSILTGLNLYCFGSECKNKILEWTEFKASADDKLYIAKMIIFLLDGLENIVVKGGNGGYQHFLLFPTMFSKVIFLWLFNPFPNDKF